MIPPGNWKLLGEWSFSSGQRSKRLLKNTTHTSLPHPPLSSSSHSDNSLPCWIALPLQFYWKCSHWPLIKFYMTACARILPRWRWKGCTSLFSCNRQSWQRAWSKVLKVRHSWNVSLLPVACEQNGELGNLQCVRGVLQMKWIEKAAKSHILHSTSYFAWTKIGWGE